MKMRSAESCRSPTRTSRASTNCPHPLITSRLLNPSSHAVRLRTAAPTMASFRAFTARISTATSPRIVTPNSRAWRAAHAARALAISALVGVQPLFTQVLPLDDRNLLTRFGELCPQERAGLASADHDGIKVLCHDLSLITPI